MSQCLNMYFDYINQIAVLFLLIAAIAVGIMRKEWSLDVILTPALTSAAIPTGIALIICAFSPSYLVRLADLHVHIAVAGVVLLVLAVVSLHRSFKRNDE